MKFKVNETYKDRAGNLFKFIAYIPEALAAEQLVFLDIEDKFVHLRYLDGTCYPFSKDREDILIPKVTKEVNILHAKLAKIKFHLLSAKEYMNGIDCIQPCDKYGVCLKCSTEGDILIALMEYKEE